MNEQTLKLQDDYWMTRKQPVAIIQVTEVFVSPMNEVPVAFALAEGEGDYAYWWNAHDGSNDFPAIFANW